MYRSIHAFLFNRISDSPDVTKNSFQPIRHNKDIFSIHRKISRQGSVHNFRGKVPGLPLGCSYLVILCSPIILKSPIPLGLESYFTVDGRINGPQRSLLALRIGNLERQVV